MRVRLPVREPELWRKAGAIELPRLLHLITGDKWELDFTSSLDSPGGEAAQECLFSDPIDAPMEVALFSGGLDSFAGAAQRVAQSPDKQFVFVSAVTNSRHSAWQALQLREIARRCKRRPLRIPISLCIEQCPGFGPEENSQRTRAFLYMTLGAVSALSVGASALYIYENGIGALNLPYDETQLGTRSSCGVNPITLARMSEFVGSLAGGEFHIESPFSFSTKAEMCEHPSVVDSAHLIPKTFSCDRPPRTHRDKPQCGWCTSCLLRRLSLYSAGLSTFDSGHHYRFDLLSLSAAVDYSHLQHLEAMEWQFLKLKRGLSAKCPWETLVLDFHQMEDSLPELKSRTGRSEADIKEALIAMYSRYVDQWGRFPARRLTDRKVA